jgi:hypothetical protein
MPGRRLNWVVADIVKRSTVWDIEEARDDAPGGSRVTAIADLARILTIN